MNAYSLAAPTPLTWPEQPTATWRAVSRGICALSWSLALTAVVLQAVHRTAPQSLAYWLMDVVTAVVYGGVTLVMLPRSRHLVTWIIAAVAVGCAVAALATQYIVLSQQHGLELPATGLLIPAVSWAWMPGTYGAMAIMPWVVTQGRWSRGTTAVVVVGTVCVAVATLTSMTVQYAGAPTNPLAIRSSRWQDAIELLGPWPHRAIVVLALAGVVHLLARWLRNDHGGGRGFGWLSIGLLFMAVSFIPLVVTVPERWAETLAELSGVGLIVAQAFLPAALLVVVLGQRLWDVDYTVSRATVWLLLSGLVAGGYVAVAWLGGKIAPGSQELTGAVAVGAVAVLGHPLRFWVQQRVDHLVYGRGSDPALLMRTIGGGLSGRDPERTGIESLMVAVQRGLRLGYVEVRPAEGARPAPAVTGEATGPVTEVPLSVEGRRVGTLRVAARPGEQLDARTRASIEQVAGFVAVAIQLAWLNDELETARDRVVEVRHEERRLLRRELHDGLGPALVGIGLGLAATENLQEDHPTRARELLAGLRVELDRRAEDVRTIARTLLPPALDEGDLSRALETLASRLSGSGFDVRTTVDGVESLDIRRQVATYHIASEAVVNAHRHASSSRCVVAVSGRPDGSLRLVVSDDGRGISHDAPDGIGLTSMRERAEELGGTFAVERQAVGTRVSVTLP
jgi:signal transduction histidine kinase